MQVLCTVETDPGHTVSGLQEVKLDGLRDRDRYSFPSSFSVLGNGRRKSFEVDLERPKYPLLRTNVLRARFEHVAPGWHCAIFL